MADNCTEAFYRDEHAKDRKILRTADDVDNMIDDLLSGPEFENTAKLCSLARPELAGFPDHEFTVGISRSRNLGIVSIRDENGNADSIGDSTLEGEVAYFFVQHRRDYPAYAEVPISVVRQAVKEFVLSGGQRPTCVEWREPEF
ncbi:Imm1 family immunity protein [Streptomyces sp. S.PB5]|uniref:Imm1 family immunity protein n=1 Tax=Streptomyces sp. S.PB5 TaxID=3020844 RepID=UPI0025B0CA61|nr:Imm1 family immunity protein [Streptomyces sp. S.PB5]